MPIFSYKNMGLLKRFFISNLILVVAVVVFMATIGFVSLRSTIQEYAFSRLEFVSATKANELEKFFSQKKLIVDMIGETEKIKKFVSTNDLQGLESSVDGLISKSNSIDLVLVSAKGKILYSHQGIYSNGENILGDTNSEKLNQILEWSNRQLEPRVLLLDFERNKRYDNQEVMFIARPIFDKGLPVANIILVFSVEQFNRFVNKDLIKNVGDLGASGAISIYGEDSLLRGHGETDGVGLDQPNNLSADSLRRVESQKRWTDLVEGSDGEQYFKSITQARLPDDVNWYVEISVLKKDVFRGMYRLFAGFVLIMFTLISVVSLLSYYGNLKIIRPLYDVIDSIRILGTSEKPSKLLVSDSYELGYLVKNYNELVDRLEWTQLSRNYFEGILESIHEFVFIVERERSEDGREKFYIKQVNKSICESFRIGRYDLVGSELHDFLKLENTDFDHFIGGESDQFVEGVLSVLGTDLPVIVKPSQVRSVGEKNYVVLCNDISLQKQQQLALVRAKEEAIKASQAKSEFLAKMSHEIRTPLNVIVGVADILKTTPEMPEDRIQMVNILSSASENLLSLINDILDLSKIEAREVTVESIPGRVDNVINEVLSILKTKSEPKGLQLNFIYEKGKIKDCYIDPTRLRQIVFNLVGNAVKFTDKGSVDVVLGFQGDDEKNLLIEVRDTGIGIPREKQSLLFNSFVQADGSISRKYGGTGLGLAISKNLVELMGGRIWLTSESGAGTSFFFTIPYQPVEAKKLKLLQELEGASKVLPLHGGLKGRDGNLRILVADDSEDNRILIRAYLKDLPVELVEVESGKDALQLFENGEKFDLVFMDIQMPVMDGYTATQEIRKIERAQHLSRTPILALSANAMIEDFEKSKQMECDAHLTKPIRKNEVVNAISKYAA